MNEDKHMAALVIVLTGIVYLVSRLTVLTNTVWPGEREGDGKRG